MLLQVYNVTVVFRKNIATFALTFCVNLQSMTRTVQNGSKLMTE